MSIIQGTSKSSAAAAYEIEQSIRFNDGDSAHLSKTFSSAGDRRTWTFSAWMKRCNLGTRQAIFAATGQAYLQIGPDAASTEAITILNEGSGTDLNWYTDAVYRDPSAWMHIVWQFDSTQSTADDRTKLWVNGSRITDFTKGSTPDQNLEGAINNNVEHKIGEGHITNFYLDAYLAEIHFIDGTAKEASDFGETDSTTGQWVPKQYAGSYGSNGFHITGEDSSDLGADQAGSNDFTSSGLTSADSVPDSPTPDADSAIGNRATLMSIQDGSPTMSEGNTRFSNSGGTRIQRTTNQPLVGKTYWEVLVNNATQNTAGVSSDQISTFTNDNFYNQTTLVAGFDNANFYYNGSYSTYSQPSATQRWMFAYDADTGELWSGVNGTWHNSGNPAAGTGEVATLSTSYKWFPFIGGKSGADQQIIWGASNMSHTVPTGFTADLSSYRQLDPTIADPSAYFQTSLWNGNGSTQTITQSGNSTFEPGMIWSKARNAAQEHVIFDQVRGTTKYIQTDNSGAEGTQSGVTAFNSDGFDLGSWAVANGSGQTHVGWQWKANGSGSSNTDGDITSTVSANTTSGVSVLTYSGNGSDNQTIGHGLGIAPKMIITKRRDSSGNWTSYHDAVGINQVFYLNSNSAPTSNTEQYRAVPTSSVYTVGVGGDINNSSGTYVAYVFAEVDGFSRISSFVGTGSSDGPVIWTGFKPAFVIFKNISAASQSWEMFDNKRDGFNDSNRRLYPNTSEVEPAASDRVRLLSNGFKIVTSGGTHVNGSGNTIIYYAVAESPFIFSNAR